jgi:hypothetical protein
MAAKSIAGVAAAAWHRLGRHQRVALAMYQRNGASKIKMAASKRK